MKMKVDFGITFSLFVYILIQIDPGFSLPNNAAQNKFSSSEESSNSETLPPYFFPTAVQNKPAASEESTEAEMPPEVFPSDVKTKSSTNELPPYFFPSNVPSIKTTSETIGGVIPPYFFPNDVKNKSSTDELPPYIFPSNVQNRSSTNVLPPFYFPSNVQNRTSPNEDMLPPYFFPENITKKSSTEMLPPFIFPENTATRVSLPVSASPSENSTNAEVPPYYFPVDGGSYKVVNNSTALKLLNHNDTTTAKIQLKTTTRSSVASPTAAKQLHANDVEDPFVGTDDDDSELSNDINDEVEEIQPHDNGHQVVELEEQFRPKMGLPQTFDDTVIEVTRLSHGHLLAIFAGLLLFLSLLVYVGLVVWRNKKKYGMRERLVNEEDDYCTNNNNLRHFGI